MNYKQVDILDLNENAVKLFSQNWAILTAGEPDAHNSMTISWGFLGELWGRHTAAVFVRPHRHTFQFAQRSDYFTLSFYEEHFKPQLNIFGSKSGRDTNKYEETGLQAFSHENWVYTEKAKLVLLCKKIAVQDFDPKGFLDPLIENNYPKEDYHKIYIGEIVKVLQAELR